MAAHESQPCGVAAGAERDAADHTQADQTEADHEEAGRDGGPEAGPAELPGRRTEQRLLGDLLDGVRSGSSGALILRGQPGIGKSALLNWAVESAPDMRVLRITAVASESGVGFAGVHQVLLPLLPAADRLPAPQRRALRVAFGLEDGPAPAALIVGLAVLALVSDAAETRPVLCVVDDAQWLDDASIDVLGFVARRLPSERVAILLAVQETLPDPRLQGLPELRIDGLPVDAAQQLLREHTGHLDPSVVQRIVVESGGNPCALLELRRRLTEAQLAGRAPLPEPLPIGHRLQEAYVRALLDLPADTRTLLLLAAAGRSDARTRLWQAAATLGIEESAAIPAESTDIAAFWPDVRFHHPMLRSAVYYSATAGQRRKAHHALAAACDPDVDAEARAGHLVAAAHGPDEQVAADLEAGALRAQARGNYSTAAMVLERATMLTRDDPRRAERTLLAAQAQLLDGSLDRAEALLQEAAPGLHGPVAVAQATRLGAKLRLARGHDADAYGALLGAARDLLPLDPSAGRQALLSALEGALWDDSPTGRAVSKRVASTVQEFAAGPASAPSATDLLLTGYTLRATKGYAAAAPVLRQAINAFLTDELDDDDALQRFGLAVVAAADLMDDDALDRLTARWAHLARDKGARARLAVALQFRAVFADALRGHLAAATAASARARELADAGGDVPAASPLVPANVLAVLGGQKSEAGVAPLGVVPGAAGTTVSEARVEAVYATGLLKLSSGNYDVAADVLDHVCESDGPFSTYALPDLVEAAVRAGRRDLAERVLARLAERASASRTPLALGLLARAQALVATDDEAAARYNEAIEKLGRSQTRLQLARAHLLYGEWLRRRRRRGKAREQLRRALDIFESLGLGRLAERARVELRATGEHPRRHAAGAPEEMTPQEARIAALVSRGRTNRDIAAQLVISPNTVEYHLKKVFIKLGVTSRTQLARLVIDEATASADGAAGDTSRWVAGQSPAA